ncbi:MULTISPECIES: hypothetical protein [Bacillaceae]|uniref:hypothetical protein n=1 Tax=Bacillaceae TaxID=186817 RepID=UPI000BFB3419|nr:MULTISPECIES: hypothetical protein [Bacillaceae]PGT82750.1 hypothetical protein COD11_14095 [Bacillus sp. AFS040349]UGB33094.1 hypothetical protein LPC09_12040 [Metabacillus sp. B2-18]
MLDQYPQVSKDIGWVLVIILFVLLIIIGFISLRTLNVHKRPTSELPKPVLYLNKRNERCSEFILIAVLFILLVIVAIILKASMENRQKKMLYLYF